MLINFFRDFLLINYPTRKDVTVKNPIVRKNTVNVSKPESLVQSYVSVKTVKIVVNPETPNPTATPPTVPCPSTNNNNNSTPWPCTILPNSKEAILTIMTTTKNHPIPV